MLKPLLENKLAILTRTIGLSSTSTEKIYSIIQEFGKKIVLESMRTGKTGLKKGKRNT